MRNISPREYAKKKGLSLGYVYDLMKNSKLPCVMESKQVKRIPWDDTTQEAVNQK